MDANEPPPCDNLLMTLLHSTYQTAATFGSCIMVNMFIKLMLIKKDHICFQDV